MKAGFYNCDCMDGMKGLKVYPDKFFDLAITDPPYFSGPEKRRYYGAKISSCGIKRKEYHVFENWQLPTHEYFQELERVCKSYIVWGCNYFNWKFAPGRIVWDKCNGSSTFSDAEIAATNIHDSVRLFVYMWNGMQQGKNALNGRDMQGNKRLNEKRIHPTQKPIALYTALLSKYAKPGFKILDTHVGSASSLIACHRAGLEFWGYEIDPEMYSMALERLNEERAQIRMTFEKEK